MNMEKTKKGITLIALVITVIVLLILAGITINLTIGQDGIINRAQEAGVKNEEATAREKLELVLVDLRVLKVSNKEYNKNEYVDNVILNNGMDIYQDIVIVNGWQYEIDREELKIVQNLGRETVLSKDTKGKASFEYDKTKYIGQVEVKINVSDDAKIYTVQYNTQDNNDESTNWVTYNLEDSITVSQNGYIYGRFVNLETNEIGYRFKALIDNLDDTKPEQASIAFDKEIVKSGETANVAVSMKDNESGIDVENSKYVINQTQEEIGVDSTQWESGVAFTSNPQTIEIKNLAGGTYYVHVLSTDLAGNKIETVSSGIVVKQKVTLLSTYDFGRNGYMSGWTAYGSGSEIRFQAYDGATCYVAKDAKVNFDNIDMLTLNIPSVVRDTVNGRAAGYLIFGITENPHSSTYVKEERVSWDGGYNNGGVNLVIDTSNIQGEYYIKILAQSTIGRLYIQSGCTTVVAE